MKKALLVFAVACASPALSQAQAPQGMISAASGRETYVLGKIGAVIPQHKDLDSFDNGLAFEVAIGREISPNFAIEASVGRFSFSGSQSGYDPSVGAVVTASADVSAISVMGSLKAIAPLDKFSVYALAGIGVYFISASGDASAPGYYPVSYSDNANTVGFHVGGGASIRVSPQATLGAELKYVIATAKVYDTNNGLDSLIVGAMLGFAF